ncbi:AMP-binding protein [Pseudomarimonas salicorniae]|uniref:AMP-binding protein n=1 Tax=Pseudomarimonas salicorniae TaxID=2933270 RepID=A0ABT0GCW8_9GAMM|nr:AMP-binding protein [Lysobacter sp. CAU 1642]MCK7592376.1 AMP-binding protein [Lysobacter sp. CAU 1642]
MSAAIRPDDTVPLSLPLLDGGPLSRAISFGGAEGRIDAARFLDDVRAAARALPEARHAVNLCEDRYRFLVAFCAVALRGQTNLLPHSRAPDVVREALDRHPQSYCIAEEAPERLPPRFHRLQGGPVALDGDAGLPGLAPGQVVAIGFTSGSSGVPKANPKTWAGFCASNAMNAALVREQAGEHACIVATVPPQHMYGMETSVLLPLLGGFSVHAGRPFFPAEIADALRCAEAPRVLVSTPVHLRALLESGVDLPPLALVLSATAPLSPELAAAIEARHATRVIEMFGSTETCVVGWRRTALDEAYTRYAGVELRPGPDGTDVDAPWFAQAVRLQDAIEVDGERFLLRGRSSDLLEIAGKRASLGDLTRRLQAVPGVRDAVVFQSDETDAAGVRRLCALVVSDISEAEVLAALRESVDAVFLPRPLRRVARLPRNDTGKLPRAALLEALAAG